MYFPHGWREMPACILSGTFSLPGIDAVREYLSAHQESALLHGEIALFIFNQLYHVFGVILVLLDVAAAIGCRVTPLRVTSVREPLLWNV